jgi:serine protease
MTLSTLARTLVLSGVLFTGTIAFGQEAEFIPGDILLMLEPGASVETIVHDLAVIDGEVTGLRVAKEVSAPMRAWLLHFDNTALSQALVKRHVNVHPGVRFAQNNHVVHDRVMPNDDEFAEQWQHTNIDSQDAWDITTGGITATGDTIVVCIVENADLPHPDLIDNAWFNHQEIPGNGTDDDGNGYTDDYQGWNPGGNDDDVYGGGHGTQVAGMIGAKGNNGSQVAGANWDVKMMVVTRDGIGEDAVVESYTYPLVMRRLYNQTDGEQGAFVVATNASWGIDNADHTQYPIWCAMYDTLGTAGILNCGATANNDVDIDEVDDMPTGCESDFMVSVTATNVQDLRTFSGYGATTVDLGAPGEDVFTTSQGGGTTSTSGTSFASPLTAGIIGLLYSAPCTSMMDLVNADPHEGALYVRQALFNGVEQVGNLPGNCVTGGRVNSNNSLVWIMDNCGSCPAPYNLTATNDGLGTATLYWSSTASTTFNVRYRPEGSVDWITVPDVGTTSVSIGDVVLCTPYEFQVEGICDGETSGFGTSYVFTSEGCCTVPGGIVATALDSNTVNVQWGTVMVAISYDLRYAIEGTNDWIEVTGLTGTEQVISGLPGCHNYELQMRTTCDGTTTTDWGTSTSVVVPGCGVCTDLTFCPSSSEDASAEWIDRVRINTIDNTSGSNDGYAAFPEQGTTLEVGTPYTIFLTPGFNGGPFNENFSVWIDLNLDGQFQGLSERVFVGDESTAEVTGDLIVPEGSLLGSSRMRVIMKFNQPVANGCEDGYGFGETEDYCVTIVGASGLNENVSNGVHFFPNPADNAITFDLPMTQGKPASVEVLDNTGKAVIRQSVNQPRTRLDVAALANGLYFFRVSNGQGEIARGKFEVTRD